MKALFLVLLTAGIFFTACNNPGPGSGGPATASGISENAPLMKFEKTTHDFGKIKTIKK